jgi:hypothetical protein
MLFGVIERNKNDKKVVLKAAAIAWMQLQRHSQWVRSKMFIPVTRHAFKTT